MPPPVAPRPVVDVVGAAIVDDPLRPTCLLAARRARTERHAGRWELPGGKVDPGESLIEALVREIREELGTSVRPVERLTGPIEGGWWALTEPGAQVQYRMAVWIATVTDPPRPVEGHDELRWLTRQELFSVDWLEGDLPVIAALVKRISA
ncbi:MAG: NUDIX domain-containing protein [Dermatophilaceae bacterium]